MPDFAVCKSGFASNGITNGKDMCAQLLEEFEVAVSIHFIKKNYNMHNTLKSGKIVEIWGIHTVCPK